MKRNKLLFVTPFTIALAIVPSITSCSKNKMNSEDVIENLFAPLEGSRQNPPEKYKNLVDVYKDMSEDEKKSELIYDLFIEPTTKEISSNKSIYDLYKEKYLTAIVNIKECSSELSGVETSAPVIKSSFRGYINFVFTKEFEDYKINDYILITYMLPTTIPYFQYSGWGLIYKTSGVHTCIGFIESKKGGEDQPLQYLENAKSLEEHPNTKNWF